MPIVWLASFPKSGNTWARALIANYYADGDRPVDINRLPDLALSDAALWPYERAAGRRLGEISLADLMPFKPKAHAILAASQKGLALAKTHTALLRLHGVPTITPAATAAAIYIVRNPLDVALSYADHYGHTPAQAVEAMASPSLTTRGRVDRAPEYLGDWSSHVRGWTEAEGLAHIVLRFEDLETDAHGCLERTLAFLRQPTEPTRIDRAVKNSSFETLANQELLGGFKERSKNQKRFFRAGRSGQWRDHLAPDLVRAIIDVHGAVMATHGYLDDKGDPI